MQSNTVWSPNQWNRLHQMSNWSMPYLHVWRLCYYYMSNVCGKLHENYLKRKRILICGWEEEVSLRVSKAEKNPGRPNFVCRERDCRFFQWADVKLSRKIRKNKPNDSIEQSPWLGLLEGGWPVMWTRGDHWFPWRQPHMDPTPQRTLETSKSKPCFPSPGAVTQGRRETSHRDVKTRYQSHCDENSNKKKDMNDMVSNWFFSPPKKSPQQRTPPRSARACPRSTKRPPTF